MFGVWQWLLPFYGSSTAQETRLYYSWHTLLRIQVCENLQGVAQTAKIMLGLLWYQVRLKLWLSSHIANLQVVHQDLCWTSKSQTINRRHSNRSSYGPDFETLLPGIYVL
jgi:hypothetical protein